MTASPDYASRPTLFAAINSEADRLRVRRMKRFWCAERPSLNQRVKYTKIATGSALAYCEECRLAGTTPTEDGAAEAMDNGFSGTTLDEVGSLWLNLLLPIIARIVIDWFLRRREQENEQ
jgi:hypothetical protein